MNRPPMHDRDPSAPLVERAREVGIVAWALLGVGLAIWAAWWLVSKVSIVFLPVVLAAVVVFLLDPAVSWLEEHRVPRLPGTLLCYVGVVVTLAAVGFGLTPVVRGQVEEFGDRLPQLRRSAARTIIDIEQRVEDTLGFDLSVEGVLCALDADEMRIEGVPSAERCDRGPQGVLGRFGIDSSTVTNVGLSVLENIGLIVVGLVAALYLLIDLPRTRQGFLGLIPPSRRDEARALGAQLNQAIGGFFRGQLFVALAVGVLSAIGFRVIGLPFWLLIGAVAGFFNLIPLVGPYIGGGIGFVVGLLTGGIGLGLQAALVEFAVQQVDNHLISPNVMKRTVNLHPATVVIAILAGAAAAGIWGALLALPLTAALKILLLHLWRSYALDEPVGTEPDTDGEDASGDAHDNGEPAGGAQGTS